MGITDKFKASMASYNLHSQFNASLGAVGVIKGQITYMVGAKSAKRSAAGVVAELDAGGNAGSKIKAGRVAAGAVIAGPIGAVVGGLMRKNANRVYVTITFPDGEQVLTDVPVKDEAAARAFVAKVNAAGRNYELPAE